jgi:hypothetical protein
MSHFPFTFADPDLHLMIDEDLIESSSNIKRRLCQVTKRSDPVFLLDKPWEGENRGCLQDPPYANVLWDPRQKVFHCWYDVANRFSESAYREGFANQSSALCYARSVDGINWEKPVIGQVLYRNSYENNMLRFLGPSGSGIASSSPYSMIYYSSPETDEQFCCSPVIGGDGAWFRRNVTLCFSADGINWRLVHPPVMTGDGETNTLGTDPINDSYIMTLRSTAHAHLAARWGREWKRHISLSRSRDLYNWTPPLTVLEVDENDSPDTEIYRMTVLAYGSGYIGLMMMFYKHTMTLDIQLAYSRDLMNWKRVCNRERLIPLGPEGSWDSRHVATINCQPYLDGDTLRWWYGGKDAPHYQAGQAAFGTATLRRDGFVCLESGDKPGFATSVPFHVDPSPSTQRRAIALNVDAAEGEARVELLDEDSNPIPGFTKRDCEPIRTDGARTVVRFKGSLGSLAGKTLRLRFHLRNAKLYAVRTPGLDLLSAGGISVPRN